MRSLYRNVFFLLGVVAIVIMLLSFDMDYEDLWRNVRKAGWWFFAVLGVWVVIYFFNALSWRQIMSNDDGTCDVSFKRIYKLTISGFALNYATPFGLMGGEPYRIMELAPQIGTARATSCVLLYVMMHIFSHVCFWLASIVLYCCCYRVSMSMAIVLVIGGSVCVLIAYFFLKGYRNGMVVKTFRILGHIPYVCRWSNAFYTRECDRLRTIDEQIAALHNRRRITFYRSFFFEFTARVMTSVEVYFILKILTPSVSFIDCVVIMAFTSFFSNLFFFSPMQLGAREGGFALSVGAASLSGAFGVYTALITRIRELIWIAIGITLMKVGNKKAEDEKTLKPKGLIFDYGGTLDQPGRHWFNVFWDAIEDLGLRVDRESYRNAYVYAERKLARQRIIEPGDNFHVLLLKKVEIQFEYLTTQGIVRSGNYEDEVKSVADVCYDRVRDQMKETRAIMSDLSARYPIVLVSNFYGNLKAVLADFGIDGFFRAVVESSVVGVRKPSPDIFRLGVKEMGLKPEEVCVIGDSFVNDIVPSSVIGCSTIWLRGESFREEQVDENVPTCIIEKLSQVEQLL